MSAIEQRLARLEQAAARLEQAESPPETEYVWVDAGETVEDTIARHFKGQPKNVTVVGYRWADPAVAPVQHPAFRWLALIRRPTGELARAEVSADGENTLWIITEGDRSATTFLLPSEY